MLQGFYLQKTKQNKTPKKNFSLVGTISFSATSQVNTNSTVLCQHKEHVSSQKRVRRLWQSFTCLSTHCQSLLLKINFPSGPSRAKANKYKVIANSIQEELREPQFQLHLQQEIWPLRSLADRTMTMAVSQSLVFLGGDHRTSELCHTEVPRWEYQCGMEGPLCIFQAQGPGKAGRRGQPNHRATPKSCDTKTRGGQRQRRSECRSAAKEESVV